MISLGNGASIVKYYSLVIQFSSADRSVISTWDLKQALQKSGKIPPLFDRLDKGVVDSTAS